MNLKVHFAERCATDRAREKRKRERRKEKRRRGFLELLFAKGDTAEPSTSPDVSSTASTNTGVSRTEDPNATDLPLIKAELPAPSQWSPFMFPIDRGGSPMGIATQARTLIQASEAATSLASSRDTFLTHVVLGARSDKTRSELAFHETEAMNDHDGKTDSLDSELLRLREQYTNLQEVHDEALTMLGVERQRVEELERRIGRKSETIQATNEAIFNVFELQKKTDDDNKCLRDQVMQLQGQLEAIQQPASPMQHARAPESPSVDTFFGTQSPQQLRSSTRRQYEHKVETLSSIILWEDIKVNIETTCQIWDT